MSSILFDSLVFPDMPDLPDPEPTLQERGLAPSWCHPSMFTLMLYRCELCKEIRERYITISLPEDILCRIALMLLG